jgi:hypothetical protein
VRARAINSGLDQVVGRLCFRLKGAGQPPIVCRYAQGLCRNTRLNVNEQGTGQEQGRNKSVQSATRGFGRVRYLKTLVGPVDPLAAPLRGVPVLYLVG